jgi:hypothetical protein
MEKFANLYRIRNTVVPIPIWEEKNWLLHRDNAPSHTSFFTWEYLTKNNVTLVPHPLYLSMFPRSKIKLKDRHFDTTEVIEEDSQAVLNTLTEHDFQDAFKKGRSSGNGAYACKGTTSRVIPCRSLLECYLNIRGVCYLCHQGRNVGNILPDCMV